MSVLPVDSFHRLRRRPLFRRSGAACARYRGGIQVAARGSGAGTLSGRERAKVRGGDSGTPAKPRRRFFFDLRAFLGRLLAEFANATGGREARLLRVEFLARRDRKSTRLLQSLMRISYAVFCLKKKITQHYIDTHHPILDF